LADVLLGVGPFSDLPTQSTKRIDWIGRYRNEDDYAVANVKQEMIARADAKLSADRCRNDDLMPGADLDPLHALGTPHTAVRAKQCITLAKFLSPP
jgi:hypothetical protein